MSLTTMWTHGNSLRVEDPGEYQTVRHRGYAAELTFARPRDDEDPDEMSPRYMHVPIPTPAWVDGSAPWLTNVYVLYQTKGSVGINQIYVYDANNVITNFSNDPTIIPLPPPTTDPNAGLIGYGDHLTLGRTNKFPLPEPYVVGTGIGVTLSCKLNTILTNGPDSDPWMLYVTAVGADFVYPNSNLSFYSGFTEISRVPTQAKRAGK